MTFAFRPSFRPSLLAVAIVLSSLSAHAVAETQQYKRPPRPWPAP